MTASDALPASELPVDPTAFRPLATPANRDLPIGFVVESGVKKITLDKSRIFQGWPSARNRHTDYTAAQATGLREPNINGAQSAEILGELFIKFFGTGYLGGTLAINFLGFVLPDDELTARAVVVDKHPEGERVRLILDIWLENNHGQKVLAGTASGLVSVVQREYAGLEAFAHMDFAIPPELAMLKQAAREFVSRELAPLEAEVDRADDIPAATLRGLRKKAVDLGFYGFNLPAAVGGGGVGAIGEVLIGEEVGRTSVPLGEAIGRLPQSLVFCEGDQVEWLLRPALRADVTVCNALTEPEAGSDLGGIQSRAVRDGSGWCISGSKQFISGAETSDYILVLAVTDPSAPLRHRFTTLIVERNHPSLHFTHRFRKMGWHGHHLSAFALDNCMVGDDHVLGEVGAGFDTIMASINTMRLYIAAKCVGAAQYLLRLARDYAQTRRTFDRKLAEHQAIQFMLADIDVELEAARLLVLAGAWKADTCQPDVRIAASRAKLYASEMAGRAADAAVQIFGGAGFMADLPVERMYRDLRGYRIGEGSSEMQRIQIARHLLAQA